MAFEVLFIFCFILFDIVLALSKKRKFAFYIYKQLIVYIKEKEPSVCFLVFLKKDIFNNSVLGFLQGMIYTLD